MTTYGTIVNKQLADILREVAREYPDALREGQLSDIPRIAFNISLACKDLDLRNASICDLGGGVGLFSVGCAAMGFKRVVLIDDFGDAVYQTVGDSIFELHRRYGVEIISRDVIRDGINDAIDAIDVITSFDSMEHWHHSPKALFRQVMQSLNPGGRFILGVPNSVNLRKRISVPLGIAKWSTMNDWYEQEAFRGHVREPDVDDLAYIASDMELNHVRIYGRNWLGYRSGSRLIQLATYVVDYPLRLWPSLCSDIYLIGSKN